MLARLYARGGEFRCLFVTASISRRIYGADERMLIAELGGDRRDSRDAASAAKRKGRIQRMQWSRLSH